MRKADPDLPPDATRQQAAEVLELGQTLFDAVIEAVSSPAAGDAAGGLFPTEDVRAAADVFFLALRIRESALCGKRAGKTGLLSRLWRRSPALMGRLF